MHRTYELYVRHADGHVRFEPLTHRGSLAEVMRHVQNLLDTSGALSVDVHEGGDPVFSLLGRETER